MTKDYEIKVYTESEELPRLLEGNFFHSLELFEISERVPGDTPVMAVASKDGQIAGQLLAVLHTHRTWFPPFIYTHAHAHGEGIYLNTEQAEEIFPLLLHSITRTLCNRHCLYIEFSELQKKMFGYRHFRRLGYFPVEWQEIYNSLHSMPPEERLTERTRRQIESGENKGLECHPAHHQEEVEKFYQLYRNFCRFKPRRYVPPIEYFESMNESSGAKLFVTTYGGWRDGRGERDGKDGREGRDGRDGRDERSERDGRKDEANKRKIVGGCTLAFSEGDAYLWHLASRRKRYIYLHPDTMTVWHAISYAHQQGCRHIHFMDVGLPWKRNPYRDFIRSFGGKPVAKYRWFRCNIGILNRLLKWFYKL